MFEWDSNIYNVRKITITTVQLVFECGSYPMGAGRTRSGCNRFCCDWRRVVHAECGSHPMSAAALDEHAGSSYLTAVVECDSHWLSADRTEL